MGANMAQIISGPLSALLVLFNYSFMSISFFLLTDIRYKPAQRILAKDTRL